VSGIATVLAAVATIVAAGAAVFAWKTALSNLHAFQGEVTTRLRPYVHVPTPLQAISGDRAVLTFTIENSGSVPARIESMTLGGVEVGSAVQPSEPTGNLLVYPSFSNEETFTVGKAPELRLELHVSYDALGSKHRGQFFFNQPMILTLATSISAKPTDAWHYVITYGRETAN
jgi:hypothetical protein